MTTPRRHHYLPQFYQAAWCVDDQFVVHDKKSGKARHASPPSTAVIRDYYRIVYGSGKADFRVEGIFAHVEGRAKECIQRLEDGRSLNQAAKYELAQFVALLHTRVPTFMDRFDQRAEELLKRHIVEAIPDEAAAARWLESQRDLPPRLKRYTPQKLLSALRGDGYRIRVPAAYRIGAALQSGMALAGEIVSRHWRVLRSPKNTRLITSDNPVLVDIEWHPELPVGITVHQVALSPSLLLRTGLPGATIGRGTASVVEVQRHNLRMSAAGQRFVLGSYESDFPESAV